MIPNDIIFFALYQNERDGEELLILSENEH